MANLYFKHNDHTYVINKDETLKNMLTKEELLQLPLSAWKELFEQKDGTCCNNLMFTVLKAVVSAYGEKVKSFYYKDKEYWFDSEKRTSLLSLANCGQDTIDLVIGDNIITLSTDKVKDFISQLELYSGKCFVATAKHLQSIKELHSVEDVINYDYTTGYPDKIILNE